MSPLPESSTLDLDTRTLSNFVYEFNIARRHVSAYPSNHPIILASLSKVTDLLSLLLSTRNDITIGIAKDTLLVGDSSLDKNNPVYRDVARLFFGHGIAAVTFNKQFGPEDLLNFYSIITLKRDDIEKSGGIVNRLSAAKVKGVQVRPIDYAAFRATDEDVIAGSDQIVLEKESALIWESFVRSLLQGTLADDPLPTGNTTLLDPAVISEVFNKRHQQSAAKGVKAASYVHTITDFLKQLDVSDRGVQKEELLFRLSAFINKLSPELRRQFLNSAFSSLANHNELATPVLTRVSEEAILDALDEMSDRKTKLPQMMLDLIGRLSGNLAVKTRAVSAQRDIIDDDQLKEKLRVIFQEENPEKFVPDNYLKALRAIIADNSISISEQLEITTLRNSIANHNIEEQISHVILEIINSSSGECNSELMQRNLQELCEYFLGMGDFKELANIHDKMALKSASTNDEKCIKFMETFADPAVIDEVLNGVNFWGKSKFGEISNFIEKVGEPFVGPILERLAEEQNMSMRRFYLERLQKIGAPARNAAIARLRDGRWYFVRNLILLLKNLGDPSVIPYLRKMASHPHSKVRYEAVKALLGYKDSEGDQILLRDMNSGEKETILNAVRLAENSQNAEVLRHLTDNLNRNGLSAFEYELKSASIHSLGVIGNPSSIQGLERFLKSRAILRSAQLNNLKIEVVQSLIKYPAKAVLPLLKTLINSGKSDIRQAAEESFRQLNGGELVD